MTILRTTLATVIGITLFCFPVFAEKVGKVTFKGQPESLNNSIMTVPNGSVALSEQVYAGIPEELLAGSDIDANPSMMQIHLLCS